MEIMIGPISNFREVLEVAAKSLRVALPGVTLMGVVGVTLVVDTVGIVWASIILLAAEVDHFRLINQDQSGLEIMDQGNVQSDFSVNIYL